MQKLNTSIFCKKIKTQKDPFYNSYVVYLDQQTVAAHLVFWSEYAILPFFLLFHKFSNEKERKGGYVWVVKIFYFLLSLPTKQGSCDITIDDFESMLQQKLVVVCPLFVFTSFTEDFKFFWVPSILQILLICYYYLPKVKNKPGFAQALVHIFTDS